MGDTKGRGMGAKRQDFKRLLGLANDFHTLANVKDKQSTWFQVFSYVKEKELPPYFKSLANVKGKIAYSMQRTSS